MSVDWVHHTALVGSQEATGLTDRLQTARCQSCEDDRCGIHVLECLGLLCL